VTAAFGVEIYDSKRSSPPSSGPVSKRTPPDVKRLTAAFMQIPFYSLTSEHCVQKQKEKDDARHRREREVNL